MGDKTSNSLMKHTKAQLVDIIFRKDNIEKDLREMQEDIVALSNNRLEKLNNLKKEYKELCDNYDTLNHDYEEVCDEIASLQCEINNNNLCIKGLKILNIILFIGIIGVLVFL